MNFNILAYCIYFGITFFIIIKVGNICYANGNIYVNQLIPKYNDLCRYINRLLLMGYYLLNIGYCATTILSWETISSINNIIEIIATKTATILLIIAILHYANIFFITKYIQKIIH